MTARKTTIPAVIGPWIGGWRAPATGATQLPIVNPATEEPVVQLAEDDAASVAAAVDMARRQFSAGVWSARPVEERKRVLLRIRDLILARREELARLESTNTGAPLRQTLDRHVPRAALNFDFFAEYISQANDPAFQQNPDFVTFVRRDPVGVAALIAPWNAPLALATMKLAGALAFGNSCVLKPSELTPLPFVPLMDILREAGVPEGVVSLVNGRGNVTGSALVTHPDVDVIAFTGGTATGRLIGEAAGRGLKKVVTELGGKSANIVFADADLDRALDAAVVAGYSNNGQQCLAGSRLLLQRPIATQFIERLLARVRGLRLGPPDDLDTEVGPLISSAHFERVSGFAHSARAEGAEILAGGARSARFGRGYYFEPTLALARDNRLTICQEEIFGPFVTILVFDELEEAISIANDTAFGLVSYVWTGRLATAMTLADRLATGIIWINTPLFRELRAPFGGFRNSGVGRAGGDWSRALFTQEKAVSIPVRDFPLVRMGLPS
jgi:acyl-CoA reductase-like NAD-dependent aldehyde dehydrogenase